MPAPAPTFARVASLGQWANLFSPAKGVFRAPSTQGQTIEHLDIDIRFVPTDYDAKDPSPAGDIDLPSVCVLTLRGGEYCQDSDERMDVLVEVLSAIKPVEVRWLNAAEDLAEQRTYATVCVHPSIIAAGNAWAATGTLRKLVIQGGFPCPNLSAPTPFAVTPAATPLPSPGGPRSFGMSSLPALSLHKPKMVDEVKLHERAERKRLAEYTLKPRFDFAFASWRVEVLEWSFEGRFTPTGIHNILSYALKSFNKSIDNYPLPSLFVMSPIPDEVVSDLAALPSILEMCEEGQAWLEDCAVLVSPSHKACTPFRSPLPTDTRDRQAARLKAALLSQGLFPSEAEDDVLDSPMGSVASLPAMSASMTDGASEEEAEATTPELGTSIVLEAAQAQARKASLPSIRTASEVEI